MTIITNSQQDQLRAGCEQLRLDLSDQQFAALNHYLENLLKWNQAFNLTAIRDRDEMVVKHLLDSLAIAPFATGANGLDVGTGPGLPGIPLAIYRPEQQWTLIDSNGKKTRFLLQMKAALNLKNMEVVKGRIEALAKNVQYDVITSRAFASLSSFVGVCLPFLPNEGLEKKGRLLAMKGQLPEAELAALDQKQMSIKVWPIKVPFLDEARHLIEVQPR